MTDPIDLTQLREFYAKTGPYLDPRVLALIDTAEAARPVDDLLAQSWPQWTNRHVLRLRETLARYQP